MASFWASGVELGGLGKLKSGKPAAGLAAPMRPRVRGNRDRRPEACQRWGEVECRREAIFD